LAWVVINRRFFPNSQDVPPFLIQRSSYDPRSRRGAPRTGAFPSFYDWSDPRPSLVVLSRTFKSSAQSHRPFFSAASSAFLAQVQGFLQLFAGPGLRLFPYGLSRKDLRPPCFPKKIIIEFTGLDFCFHRRSRL